MEDNNFTFAYAFIHNNLHHFLTWHKQAVCLPILNLKMGCEVTTDHKTQLIKRYLYVCELSWNALQMKARRQSFFIHVWWSIYMRRGTSDFSVWAGLPTWQIKIKLSQASKKKSNIVCDSSSCSRQKLTHMNYSSALISLFIDGYVYFRILLFYEFPGSSVLFLVQPYIKQARVF